MEVAKCVRACCSQAGCCGLPLQILAGAMLLIPCVSLVLVLFVALSGLVRLFLAEAECSHAGQRQPGGGEVVSLGTGVLAPGREMWDGSG